MKQLYIDVNDPRNQFIVKMLRMDKNQLLLRLLAEDARNLLANQ